MRGLDITPPRLPSIKKAGKKGARVSDLQIQNILVQNTVYRLLYWGGDSRQCLSTQPPL